MRLCRAGKCDDNAFPAPFLTHATVVSLPFVAANLKQIPETFFSQRYKPVRTELFAMEVGTIIFYVLLFLLAFMIARILMKIIRGY
jgi:formate-dependent nitrite reductase membrane component NrfD